MQKIYINSEDFNDIWEFLRDVCGVDDRALSLVCNINGMSIETLNDVIYSETGYHDIEQLIECEYNEDYTCDDDEGDDGNE